jgi:hypothetical protein
MISPRSGIALHSLQLILVVEKPDSEPRALSGLDSIAALRAPEHDSAGLLVNGYKRTPAPG